jgi:hypothetical protein
MQGSSDRRAAERFFVNADTSCSFVSPVIEDFGPAKIKNVSMDGVALLLTKRVEPGTLLTICLSNPAKGLHKTVLVRVVHATPEMGGGCTVGGTFLPPLTYQELTTLIL